MSHVIPAFGADFDLAFIEDGVSTFGYGVDPVLDGEDAGCGCAVRRDADGDETGIGREEATEAGAVLVAGAADGVIDGLDEVAEGGGGRAQVTTMGGGAAGVWAWIAGATARSAAVRAREGGRRRMREFYRRIATLEVERVLCFGMAC
jgi:hypothetical protein